MEHLEKLVLLCCFLVFVCIVCVLVDINFSFLNPDEKQVYCMANNAKNNIFQSHTVSKSESNDIIEFLNQTNESYYFSTARGTSMFPTISPGNILLIKKYSDEKINEGDIIVFHYNNSLVSHRVKSVYSDRILTQGDDNSYFEEVYFSNITGIVKGIILK